MGDREWRKLQRESRAASRNQTFEVFQEEKNESASEYSADYKPSKDDFNEQLKRSNLKKKKKQQEKRKRIKYSSDEEESITESISEDFINSPSPEPETWKFACVCGIKGTNYDGN